MRTFLKSYVMCLLLVAFSCVAQRPSSPHSLFSSSGFTRLELLSKLHFKFGVGVKVSNFSYHLRMDKVFYEPYFVAELLNIGVESLVLAVGPIIKPKDLQNINCVGYSMTLSFRSWCSPLNLGLIIHYFKTSPRWTVGIVFSVSYELLSVLNIGGQVALSKIWDKNVEGLIENKDYFSKFLSDLNSDLCQKMQQNRDLYRKHDKIFDIYIDLVALNSDCCNHISRLSASFKRAQFEQYEEDLKAFQEKLQALETLLKQRYLAVKNVARVSHEYFLKSEVQEYYKQYEKLDDQILELESSLETLQEDSDRQTVKNAPVQKYLNCLVQKTLWKPIYMIEIHNKNANEYDKIERKALVDEED